MSLHKERRILGKDFTLKRKLYEYEKYIEELKEKTLLLKSRNSSILITLSIAAIVFAFLSIYLSEAPQKNKTDEIYELLKNGISVSVDSVSPVVLKNSPSNKSPEINIGNQFNIDKKAIDDLVEVSNLQKEIIDELISVGYISSKGNSINYGYIFIVCLLVAFVFAVSEFMKNWNESEASPIKKLIAGTVFSVISFSIAVTVFKFDVNGTLNFKNSGDTNRTQNKFYFTEQTVENKTSLSCPNHLSIKNFSRGEANELDVSKLNKEIEKIVKYINSENPAALLVIGSADLSPIDGNLKETYPTNAVLAYSRAVEVKNALLEKKIPLEKSNIIALSNEAAIIANTVGEKPLDDPEYRSVQICILK